MRRSTTSFQRVRNLKREVAANRRQLTAARKRLDKEPDNPLRQQRVGSLELEDREYGRRLLASWRAEEGTP